MSHKASAWLFELPPKAMSHAEFRVMCHLCDAHNSKRDPATACFPSQERLQLATGMSNGGLNNSLNVLERAGFIRRIRGTDPGTPSRRTYYILGFDLDNPQEQTPLSGVCANSTFDGANSSFQGGKLHSVETNLEVTCNKNLKDEKDHDSEQKKDARLKTTSGVEKPKSAESEKAPLASIENDPQAGLRALAEVINSGKYVAPSAVSNTKRDELLASRLVTAERAVSAKRVGSLFVLVRQ